ncbi:hypothetical protein GCM10023314_05540 [Algibacter agarivorans]|uniref:Uncharacterized protein n=2 Tax=Algibacter agarivorans TaxID=1109741 RepID=A0ABP9GER8_9FLAO
MLNNRYKDVLCDFHKYPQSISNVEVYFLRLTLHGQSVNEIAEFLDVDLENLYEIEKGLFIKFYTSNWYDLVLKGFQLNLLKPEDFVNNMVRNTANLFSCEINNLLNSEGSDHISINTIKASCLNYLANCYRDLKGNNTARFSKIEIEFLKFKFNGNETDNLSIKFELDEKSIEKLKKHLFEKLGVQDWFNCYKKVFEFDILQWQDYLDIDIDVLAIELSAKLITIQTFKHVSLKERQLFIYHDLLKFYHTIEIAYLSKYKF